MFNPMRLTIARERRAMSKKGLAEKGGFAPNTIFRYESGELVPPSEAVNRLAFALEFPVNFFFGADLDRPRRDNASFRGLASKSARIMDAALASGSMAYLFDDWVSRGYGRGDADLPDLGGGIAPEAAAKVLRQQWRLGDKPIEKYGPSA